jgi:hypothetical protein
MYYIVLICGLVVGTASATIYELLKKMHKNRISSHGYTDRGDFDIIV